MNLRRDMDAGMSLGEQSIILEPGGNDFIRRVNTWGKLDQRRSELDFDIQRPTTTNTSQHDNDSNNVLIFCYSQKTTPVETKARISRSKGRLSRRTAFVREIVKEVAGLAPYERRVVELLRNSQDKRARKLAKKRVRFFTTSTLCCNNKKLTSFVQLGTIGRAKAKVDEMQKVIAEARRAGH